MASIKTTGAEIQRFWNDKSPEIWPDDAYVDDMLWKVNGVEQESVDVSELNPSDIVVVEGAIFYGDGHKELAGVMRRWRKLQSHSFHTVEVPNDQIEALEAFLATIKGKIVKG